MAGEIFAAFADNLFGYDAIIFIAFGVNLYFFYRARKSAKELYGKLHKKLFVPEYMNSDKAEREIGSISETELASMRENSLKWYSVFCSLTSIFPMLGILGTVISLLGVSGDMQTVGTSFMAALTSTFWGIVFGIIFKLMDSFISPIMEDNDRSAALFLDRSTRVMEKRLKLEKELEQAEAEIDAE